MGIKNILETVFLRAPVALFEFVAGCWGEYPLITLAVLAAVVYGLYCAFRTVKASPHTLIYLIYGILSGAATVRFALGQIGLDSPSDAASSALIGAGVGLIIGFCTMLGAAGSERLSFLSFLLVPIAVLLATICIFFAVATVLVLRENLIAGILCLAFFGAVLAPAGGVVVVLILRD